MLINGYTIEKKLKGFEVRDKADKPIHYKKTFFECLDLVLDLIINKNPNDKE